MAARALPGICTCSHAETDHRAAGRCRMRDSYTQPCGCPSFERDAAWSGDPDPDPEDETPGWAAHDEGAAP